MSKINGFHKALKLRRKALSVVREQKQEISGDLTELMGNRIASNIEYDERIEKEIELVKSNPLLRPINHWRTSFKFAFKRWRVHASHPRRVSGYHLNSFTRKMYLITLLRLWEYEKRRADDPPDMFTPPSKGVTKQDAIKNYNISYPTDHFNITQSSINLSSS